MMCHVMGVTSRQALQHARDLGIAMQLTNIARDVLEDWQRGRCYLPASWMERELGSDPPPSCRVKPAVEKTLLLADQYYERGMQGIQLLPPTARPAIHLAGRLYRGIGHEIRRCDHEVMQARVCLPKWRVLTIASPSAGHWLLATFLNGLTLLRGPNWSSFPLRSPNFKKKAH